MLYATGFSDEDFDRAQIGVGSVWWSGNPCNMHLMELNNRCSESVNKAGLKAMQFNSIGVSDGITNGTEGMKYSLQLREIIADSFETMTMAQLYDGNIAIPSCDKNMPGVLMAMGRHNRPAIMVYGGTILPGSPTCGTQNPAVADKIDIISAFQSYGQYLSKQINNEEKNRYCQTCLSRAGACGGMYTANTMASASEVLGLTLPFRPRPRQSQRKSRRVCQRRVRLKEFVRVGLETKRYCYQKSFENAIAYIIATGGSTNAVLHLIAIASSFDITITVDDFQRISDNTPLLADFKPSGKYVMADLQNVGGTPAVMKYLIKEGIIDGTQLSVTGKTINENLAKLADLPEAKTLLDQYQTH